MITKIQYKDERGREYYMSIDTDGYWTSVQFNIRHKALDNAQAELFAIIKAKEYTHTDFMKSRTLYGDNIQYTDNDAMQYYLKLINGQWINKELTIQEWSLDHAECRLFSHIAGEDYCVADLA